ncbi:hypothetical protein BDN70DRAFT_910065 [Pholiota conissans]|uniref:Hemerythrin-like domain-containing protein n=1 Tax=Pholiota conissans TaxID=109636 RepID=A0A9P6D7I2_9AGAR|nr:hypothetical protein BDN70DRAFT_910065 [Pholiota conissans]
MEPKSTSDSELRWPLIPLANAPVRFDPNGSLTAWFSVDMTLIHNVIIRSINAMWKNAPLVIPADEAAFAGYVLSGIQLIHTHHHTEEYIIFPRLQEKLNMQHNIEQHEEFQEPMQQLEDYFKRVQAKENKYDGEKAQRLLEAFAEPLVAHLTEELDTISPEKMSVFTNEEILATNKALEEHLKSLGGFFTQLPYGLTAHDIHQAPEWPPLPGPIKWFIKNIAYFVNRSYWKFAPMTRHGEPQVYRG